MVKLFGESPMMKIRCHKRKLGNLKTKKGNIKDSLKYFLGDGLLRDKGHSLNINQSINLKEMVKSFN